MNPLSGIDRLNAVFWTGVAGFVLVTIGGLAGIHTGAVWRVPQVLRAQVQVALADAGYPGLDVRMDGQKAIVRGFVDDQRSVDAVKNAALHAAGLGGPWGGGVTEADVSGVSVRPAGAATP